MDDFMDRTISKRSDGRQVRQRSNTQMQVQLHLQKQSACVTALGMTHLMPHLCTQIAIATLLCTSSWAETPNALTPEEQAEIEALFPKDSGQTLATPRTVVPRDPGSLEIALVLDVAIAWFDSDDPQQLGAHDPSETGFNLQQLELSLGAAVDHVFRVDANLVFGLFGVELEEAYASTLALPAGLKVRVGQFLTRIGRLNPTHPHSWDFVDQPLVNGKFLGSEGSRGLGLELSWLAPTAWYLELIGSAHMATDECCARSFLGADPLPVQDPSDLLLTVALRQFFDLGVDWGLLWGLTYQGGPNPSGADNRTEIYATDLHLRFRPRGSSKRRSLTLQAELMHRRRQVPGDVLADTGLYAQWVYQHDPSWAFGVRYEWVSGVESDPLDPAWTEARHRGALQTTFFPSHFSRIRLQAGIDRLAERPDPVYSAVLAFEWVAGAHAAHDY